MEKENKTPAEIEIEKILFNYDRYILTDKEGKLNINSLKKCVKMDLQKAIELGRKESEDVDIIELYRQIGELAIIRDDLQEQLSNQKKELLSSLQEKIEKKGYLANPDDGLVVPFKEIRKIFDNQQDKNPNANTEDIGRNLISNVSEGKDKCISVEDKTANRKPELDNLQERNSSSSGFSTPDEEIINQFKEYLALERWGKGQNNDRLIELFEKALSLQRQELASLQEKIEKLPVEIKGEEDDVIMIKQALEIYKKSILKIFKEMGQ